MVINDKAEDSSVLRPTASYLTRHWRGELSLARSWWLNCVVLYGICGGILNLIAVAATDIMFGTRSAIAVAWLSCASFRRWRLSYGPFASG
jgi:hypothetical protein